MNAVMIPPASMFAVLLLIVALIFTQVRRSDRKPATSHAHTADDERLAQTGDLTEDEATLEWFKSLREPRRVVSYAYNPARYVVLEQTQPGWTHTPAWQPLKALPASPKRPVPAVSAGAENTAGTGLPLCYCGRPGNHITAAAINGSDMDAEFATGQLQAVTS